MLRLTCVADCFCAIIIYIIFLFNPESSKEAINHNHLSQTDTQFNCFHPLKMQLLSPLIFTHMHHHHILYLFHTMNNKPSKPTSEEQTKNGGVQNIKEYWTQHRTTLIAFQAQYVFAMKPNHREEEESQTKNRKGKKKDIEFEGGFLFPGREGDKEINVVQMIKQSGKHSNLKELFDDTINHSQDTLELREFVKIMLELKHSCIVKQFMQIYDNIIKEIKDIKFDQIKVEHDRFAVVDRIKDKLTGFVGSYAHTFKNFAGYLKNNQKETESLFKVTAYCFLAEKFNFNINEYYSQAFQFAETEKKKTTKKNKTDVSNH